MNDTLEVLSSSMTMSPTIAKIIPAFIAAKKEMGPLKKGANNPFFKSKYADLGSVIDVSEDALLENGIATIQSPGGDGHNISVTTLLAHISGEWIQGHLILAPIKPDPQAAGSAITYARRYALQAMCNLAAEDDDANAASKARPVAPVAVVPRQAQITPAELQDEIYGLLAELNLQPARVKSAIEWASSGRTSDYKQLDTEESHGLMDKLNSLKVQRAS